MNDFTLINSVYGDIINGEIAVTLTIDTGSSSLKSQALTDDDPVVHNVSFNIENAAGSGRVNYNADRESLIVDPDPGNPASTVVVVNTSIPADLVPGGWEITPTYIWFDRLSGDLYTDTTSGTRTPHRYERTSDGTDPTVGITANLDTINEVVHFTGSVSEIPTGTSADSSLYVDFGIDQNLDGDNDRTTYGDWEEVTYSGVRIDPSWIAADGTFSVDAALPSNFYQMDLTLGANAYVFVSDVLYVDKDGDEFAFGDYGFSDIYHSALANDWDQEVFNIVTGEGPILENYIEVDPVWLGAKFYNDDVPNAIDSVILFNATDTDQTYTVDGTVVSVAANTVIFDPLGVNLASEFVMPEEADEFSYRQRDDATVDVVWLANGLDGGHAEWGPGNDVFFAPSVSNYNRSDQLTLGSYSDELSRDAYDTATPQVTPLDVQSNNGFWVGYDSVTNQLTVSSSDSGPFVPASDNAVTLVEGQSYYIFWDSSYRDVFAPGDFKIQLEDGSAAFTPGNSSVGDIKQWAPPSESANFTFFATNTTQTSESGFGITPVSTNQTAIDAALSTTIDWSTEAGLTVDNSSGTVVIDTDYGSFTASGFNKFEDTALSDTFIGSTADEAFRFEHGGSDTVTGGGGSDQFRVGYRDDTWSLRAEDGSHAATLPYQIHVTDYDGSDEIRLESFGFDETNWQSEFTVATDGAMTTVSVDTGTATISDLFTLNGEFILGKSELYHYSDGRQVVELNLMDADPSVFWDDSFSIQQREWLGGVEVDRYTVEFEAMPALFAGAETGFVLNLSNSTQSLAGQDVAAGTGFFGGDPTTIYDAPSIGGDIHHFGVYGSAYDDYLVMGDIGGLAYWSPGDNQITFDKIDTSIFASDYWTLFSGGSYAGRWDGTQGLHFDMSSGDLVVTSDMGTTTVSNVYEVFDSKFNDTFVGSSDGEAFKSIFGGFDTVTAGAGFDKFEVQYYVDRDDRIQDGDWWGELQGMHITDYEVGEYIELQSMGFGGTSSAGDDPINDVVVTYDPTSNVTSISVSNESLNLNDVVTLDGEFAVMDASFGSDYGGIQEVAPENTVVLRLYDPNLVSNMSVTTLGGSGTETAALFNGYDYVDLTAVSAGLDSYFVLDLGVPDGVDELSTLGTDQTGSYGLSGFEGFIVAGSAVSQLGADTQIDIFTSPDANDSVVIAEGSGLSIDLGVESDWDILSFRGTDAAVDITLTDKTSYVTFEAFGGNSEVLGADAVLGSEAGDTITGYASSTNALAGSAGDDTITGGNEADALVGGDGDDTLIGGAGDDLLVDLDGNTTGSLIGGDGRDLYYVRGDETSAAHISGFGVAQDGLARGSLSSDLYNDRIAFSISSSALATIAALSQADTVNWPPSPTATEIAEYLQLRDLISLDVTNASGDGQNWELTATVNHLDAEGASVSTLLGRATFSTDTAYTIDANGVGSTLKTKVLEWDDGLDSFLDTIAQAVQDHVEFDDHALNITAGTQWWYGRVHHRCGGVGCWHLCR